MTIKFTKMQGLGNDFMVVDAIHQTIKFSPHLIQRWADRHFGIGFDQLLVVEEATQVGVDFRYRIFNADGSEVQQCGNGARCFARFVLDKGLTDQTEITVETASGVIVLYIEADGLVRVNMGIPNFKPQSLPFYPPLQQQTQAQEFTPYTLDALGSSVTVGVVSVGNPHAVLAVDDINSTQVAQLGAALESHDAFPERVNVGFAQTIDRNHIALRVYERGAAETLACGTGACAAMVVLKRWGAVDDSVTVSLPGGDLLIQWGGGIHDSVWMTGSAVTVFEGDIADE